MRQEVYKELGMMVEDLKLKVLMSQPQVFEGSSNIDATIPKNFKYNDKVNGVVVEWLNAFYKRNNLFDLLQVEYSVTSRTIVYKKQPRDIVAEIMHFSGQSAEQLKANGIDEVSLINDLQNFIESFYRSVFLNNMLLKEAVLNRKTPIISIMGYSLSVGVGSAILFMMLFNSFLKAYKIDILVVIAITIVLWFVGLMYFFNYKSPSRRTGKFLTKIIVDELGAANKEFGSILTKHSTTISFIKDIKGQYYRL